MSYQKKGLVRGRNEKGRIGGGIPTRPYAQYGVLVEMRGTLARENLAEFRSEVSKMHG